MKTFESSPTPLSDLHLNKRNGSSPRMDESRFGWNHQKNGNPFKVPENYFEDFTARMMAQIPAETVTPTASRISPMQMLHRIWAYGAVAILLISLLLTDLSKLHTPLSEPLRQEMQLSSAADEEFIYDYLMLDAENVYDYATDNE